MVVPRGLQGVVLGKKPHFQPGFVLQHSLLVQNSVPRGWKSSSWCRLQLISWPAAALSPRSHHNRCQAQSLRAPPLLPAVGGQIGERFLPAPGLQLCSPRKGFEPCSSRAGPQGAQP